MDLFANLMVLHYQSNEKAEEVCSRVLNAKNEKTPKKQASLNQFFGSTQKQDKSFSDFAKQVDKVEILEGAELERHLKMVEKKRQKYCAFLKK